MPPEDFHQKPFDEGTLTKLDLFELYLRSWLPVFLSREVAAWTNVHVFDFFAGPGRDAAGALGSPLRILKAFSTYRHLDGWAKVDKVVHFFDKDSDNISELRRQIDSFGDVPGLRCEVDVRAFPESFDRCEAILEDRRAAKLLFVDPFGVNFVDLDVFRRLVRYPTCDFLVFLPSSIAYRFSDHPAIKPKIRRPGDYYHVHRALVAYYRENLPPGAHYYLAPFSIKKGANIYGLLFGSSHPRGIFKFLDAAWKTDQVNGEADFDINREGIVEGEPFLPFTELAPTKLREFERALEEGIEAGRVCDERDILSLCVEHGVRPTHSQAVLARMKRSGAISPAFRVPQVKNFDSPRPLRPKR